MIRGKIAETHKQNTGCGELGGFRINDFTETVEAEKGVSLKRKNPE